MSYPLFSVGTMESVVPVESFLIVVEVYRFGDSYLAQCVENKCLLLGRHGPGAAATLKIGASREAADERTREQFVLVGVHALLHGFESAGVAYRDFAAEVAAGLVLAALCRVDDSEVVARCQQFLVGYLSQTIVRHGALGMQASRILIRNGGIKNFWHNMIVFFVGVAKVRFHARGDKPF